MYLKLKAPRFSRCSGKGRLTDGNCAGRRRMGHFTARKVSGSFAHCPCTKNWQCTPKTVALDKTHSPSTGSESPLCYPRYRRSELRTDPGRAWRVCSTNHVHSRLRAQFCLRFCKLGLCFGKIEFPQSCRYRTHVGFDQRCRRLDR